MNNTQYAADAKESGAPDPEKKIKVRARNEVSVDGTRLSKDQETHVTPRQYAALAAHLDKVKSLLLIACLLLGLNAGAQQYTIVTWASNAVAGVRGSGTLPLNGGTNQVVGSTANAYKFPVTITKSDMFDIQTHFICGAANTSNVQFVFDTSSDGTNWIAAQYQWTVAANGTTAVDTHTNITLFAPGYIRLQYVTNAAAPITCSNLIVMIATKPVRTGQ